MHVATCVASSRLLPDHCQEQLVELTHPEGNHVESYRQRSSAVSKQTRSGLLDVEVLDDDSEARQGDDLSLRVEQIAVHKPLRNRLFRSS